MVYSNIEQMPFIKKAVVTVGTFDGVHLAHRAVLEEVVKLAKKIGGKPVVFTFLEHPKKILEPDLQINTLNTYEEKNVLLGKCGIKIIAYSDFTTIFAKTHYYDFIKFLTTKMDIRKIVLGYDHNFGRNKEGNFYNLKKLSPMYGFEVVEVPKQEVNGIEVSSSHIRKLINQGNISLANNFLGYKYMLPFRMCSVSDDYIIGHFVQNKWVPKIIPPEGLYEIEIKDSSTLIEIGENVRIPSKNIEYKFHKVIEIHFLNQYTK